MARRRLPVRAGKKIDFKAWLAMPSLAQAITANATFIPSGFINFAAPGTILRARGKFDVQFVAGGLTAADHVKFAFGLAVLSTDAVALGPTALPDPAGDVDYPWIYWTEFFLRSISADVTEVGVQYREVVDSKAMRKIKPNETLTWVGQYVNITGNPNVQVSFAQTRVLFGT